MPIATQQIGAGLRAFVLAMLCVAMAACVSAEKRARLADIHTKLGAGYLQRGQLSVANDELRQALAADPNHVEANNVMGLLQVQLQDYEAAESYFLAALDAAPNNAEVHNNYGTFLCERGRFDAADEHFRKALADRLYRTPDLANLNAGLCALKKPAPDKAREYFRAALAINSRLTPALFQLAQLSYNAGQTLSARGYMQRYFELAHDSPQALWLAIEIERALGNRDLQAGYAMRLKAKFPDSPEAQALKSSGRPQRR